MINEKPSTTLCIGITGGIAMGKSTVAQVFQQYADKVVDADDIAKSVYTNPLFARALQQQVPLAVTNNNIDFAQLRLAIQTDITILHWLEEHIHPEVRQRFNDLLKMSRYTCFVAVVPLLFEKGFDSFCDRVIAVSVNKNIQWQRLMNRPHMTEEWAELILSQQWTDEQRRNKADAIVSGNLSKQALTKQVKTIYQNWLQQHQAKNTPPDTTT